MSGQPTPAVPCRIKNEDGMYYHPVKAPEGLCKCGVMLGLISKKEPYTFPSTRKANHAISHTFDFLNNNGIKFEKQFILER